MSLVSVPAVMTVTVAVLVLVGWLVDNGRLCSLGRYSPWATASAVAMYAGYSEDEFVQLVSESDFAYVFATENGRDRSNRLEGRLRKVWDKAEDGWNPPLREATDVRERLAALSQRIADYPRSGRTAATDHAVAVALVVWAHEVGVWTLDAGCRELSLRAGRTAHSSTSTQPACSQRIDQQVRAHFTLGRTRSALGDQPRMGDFWSR